MSSYGIVLYRADGTERMRFDAPILGCYAFVVLGNGSATIKGAYQRTEIVTSPARAIGVPNEYCHTVTVSPDDVVTWTSNSPTTTMKTLIVINYIK